MKDLLGSLAIARLFFPPIHVEEFAGIQDADTLSSGCGEMFGVSGDEAMGATCESDFKK